MPTLDDEIRPRARELAHKHTPGCTADPGDPRVSNCHRRHSNHCDQLTEMLTRFAKNEIWRDREHSATCR